MEGSCHVSLMVFIKTLFLFSLVWRLELLEAVTPSFITLSRVKVNTWWRLAGHRWWSRVGMVPSTKEWSKVLNRCSFKVSIVEVANRIWETKIGICFKPFGKLFFTQESANTIKNLSIVEQLNADECAPAMLAQADLLDVVLFWGVSTMLWTHDLPESKNRLPLKDTDSKRHSSETYSCETRSVKKCSKIFSNERNPSFWWLHLKQKTKNKKKRKILTILPLSLT